jgi:hypothetical protein
MIDHLGEACMYRERERESKGELRGMDSELCDHVFADKGPSGAIRGPRTVGRIW